MTIRKKAVSILLSLFVWAMLIFMAAMTAFAGPYDGLVRSTMTGTALQNLSGTLGIAASSKTPTEFTTTIDGTAGYNSTKQITASSGTFAGDVTALIFHGDLNGNASSVSPSGVDLSTVTDRFNMVDAALSTAAYLPNSQTFTGRNVFNAQAAFGTTPNWGTNVNHVYITTSMIAGYALRVTQEGTGSGIHSVGSGTYGLYVADNDAYPLLTVRAADKRVGVGTNAPSEAFHVVGGGLFTSNVTALNMAATYGVAAATGVFTSSVTASAFYGDGSNLTGVIQSTATGSYALRVATATYLATAPGACSAGEFINALTADGTKTCAAPAGGGDVVLASTQTFTGANTFASSVTIGGQATGVWPMSRVHVSSTAGNYTWTVPDGVGMFKVTCIGGGGAGGTNAAGGGGGGGGTAIKYVYGVAVSSQIAYTVGAAGAAGGSGGTSTFGSYCSASGGSAGGIGHYTNGGPYGVGLIGDLLMSGNGGATGGDIAAVGTQSGSGGASVFGGGGTGVNNGTGTAGGDYGGGGGGGTGATSGGKGAVIIEY